MGGALQDLIYMYHDASAICFRASPKFNKEVYVDFVAVQIKFLSFVAYIIRIYQVNRLQYVQLYMYMYSCIQYMYDTIDIQCTCTSKD